MTMYIVVVKKLDAPHSQDVHAVYSQVQQWAYSRDDMTLMVAEGGELTQEQRDEIGDEVPLVITIGGDGTVIMGAKLAMNFHQAAVIGFNLGKVGFLVDFNPKAVHDALNAAVANELKIDHRELLEVTVDGKVLGVGLNDIVVSCADSDTSFKYDLRVKKAFAGTHLANGVIFSTPTGSTAYALAVGGAIMMPELENVMQIVPIAAQTLASRPLILQGDPGAELAFYVSKNRPLTIRVDGQVVGRILPSDEVYQHTICVKTHPKKVALLHHANWNHFETLTTKLGWNR